MTTNTYQFAPSTTTSPPYQFLMTVGGAPYIIAVFWNVYAQRWYFSATVQGQQTPALTMPMVGSDGNDTPVNLVWALFGSKASMAYYPAAQTIVTVT